MTLFSVVGFLLQLTAAVFLIVSDVSSFDAGLLGFEPNDFDRISARAGNDRPRHRRFPNRSAFRLRQCLFPVYSFGEKDMGFVRVASTRFSIIPGLSRSIQSSRSLSEPSDQTTLPKSAHGVHVFHCVDAVGIVATLSSCIASRGGNILGADVFVPEKKNVFYSRSEFVFDPIKWPREQMNEDFNELAKTFKALRSVVRVPELDPKYKIAILASKQDHCLVDLLHSWQDRKLPVDITCVISNHDREPNTHVMRFLERHEIPYHYLSTTDASKRESDVLDLACGTDFLVLARYMQILSGNFLTSYGKDVINIHHGLLPSFKGGRPSRQAFDAGVKLIGATTHFVTEELDGGPIIEQMVERVSHRDNLKSFVLKSENLEKQCLGRAIKSYCELRVLPFEQNKTVVF